MALIAATLASCGVRPYREISNPRKLIALLPTTDLPGWRRRVLVCNAEVVEPVFGELGIHDALKFFGAVDCALWQAIVAPELAFPPELEDVPSVWIERNLIIS